VAGGPHLLGLLHLLPHPRRLHEGLLLLGVDRDHDAPQQTMNSVQLAGLGPASRTRSSWQDSVHLAG